MGSNAAGDDAECVEAREWGAAAEWWHTEHRQSDVDVGVDVRVEALDGM